MLTGLPVAYRHKTRLPLLSPAAVSVHHARHWNQKAWRRLGRRTRRGSSPPSARVSRSRSQRLSMYLMCAVGLHLVLCLNVPNFDGSIGSCTCAPVLVCCMLAERHRRDTFSHASGRNCGDHGLAVRHVEDNELVVRPICQKVRADAVAGHRRKKPVW